MLELKRKSREPKMKRLVSKIGAYIKAKKYAYIRHVTTHPSDRGASHINLPKAFPLYRANMDGTYKEKAIICEQTIRNTIPFLAGLSIAAGHPELKTTDVKQFADSNEKLRSALALKKILDKHGSDKGTLHNYHLFYGSIVHAPESTQSILEIGLGSNNAKVACNMGADGRPGASLRAWRDFFPNARIYGADIDASILFQEERISTFRVDQTNASSFEQLIDAIAVDFDLIIDDGLHAPDANIHSIRFLLPLLKKGGWLVIEDIADTAKPVWQVVASLLDSKAFQCHYIEAENGRLFAIQRLH